MVKFNQKFIIIIVLLLLIGGALLKQYRPTHQSFKKIEKTAPIAENNDSLKKSSTSTVSPPLPTPLVSSGDLNIHLKTFLNNLDQAPAKNMEALNLQDEIEKIQSFLEDEEVVQKLNANEVSKEDREKLNLIFLRLQSLQEVEINRNLRDLEKDVNSYQKTHAKRVKKYVQKEDPDLNSL